MSRKDLRIYSITISCSLRFTRWRRKSKNIVVYEVLRSTVHTTNEAKIKITLCKQLFIQQQLHSGRVSHLLGPGSSFESCSCLDFYPPALRGEVREGILCKNCATSLCGLPMQGLLMRVKRRNQQYFSASAFFRCFISMRNIKSTQSFGYFKTSALNKENWSYLKKSFLAHTSLFILFFFFWWRTFYSCQTQSRIFLFILGLAGTGTWQMLSSACENWTVARCTVSSASVGGG